ncbi:hypothetical protein NDU88_001795 [Pleurodeles waltl]|uniref:Uncharacterized protein n=1 Tax=Pleurodeles waltl TaxID=8319 RepID=A0AAV7VC10_PLEWA|nr:hypothetical protein NDU88_001795 [Pleurodeles waltl]
MAPASDSLALVPRLSGSDSGYCPAGNQQTLPATGCGGPSLRLIALVLVVEALVSVIGWIIVVGHDELKL